MAALTINSQAGRAYAQASSSDRILGSSPIDSLKGIGPDRLTPRYPVMVRGVVTALSGWKTSFFLQDSTGGISVDRLDSTAVHTGDEVLVQGELDPGLFAPIILSHAVTIVGKAELPHPQLPSYEELIKGTFDSRWIEITGIVHSARIENVWGRKILVLNVRMPAGSVSVHVLDYSGIVVDSLVDSTVSIRGVCGTMFNDRRQFIGLRLFVPERSEISTVSPAPAVAQLHSIQLAQLRQFLSGEGSSHRVKVNGTLTYQNVGHGLYLEDDGASIHLQSSEREKFHLGDRLEALGFAHTFGYSPGLRDAQVRRIGTGAEVKPLPLKAIDVITTNEGFKTTRYDGQLVRIQATVLEQIPNSQNEVWLVRDGNVVFQAEVAKADVSNQLSFESGSVVYITGVCVSEVDDDGAPTSFRILLRNPRDILITKSFDSDRTLVILLGCVLLICGGGALLWRLERVYGLRNEAGPSGALDSEHTFWVMRRLSFSIAVTVLALVVLSLVVQANAFRGLMAGGSIWSRVVLASAATSILLTKSDAGWKRLTSIFGSSFTAAAGLTLIWEHREASVALPLCYLLLGLGVLLLRVRILDSVAQSLLIGMGAVSLLSFASRLYGATSSFGVAKYTAMPLPLACSLLCLCGAALLAHPARGLMEAISAPGLGGFISRRLLPFSVIVPLIIGWIRLQGQLLGLYDTLWGLSFFAVANVFAFGCVVWLSAAVLNRLDFARSKVQDELRERDDRLQLVFEKSGIGDYTWEIGENRVRAHPIILKMYGSETADTSRSAEWFRTRQHADDAERIAQEVQSALNGEKPLDVEFRVVLPDGNIRWISCRGNVIYDSAGVPARINGLNIDVTARKQSEEDIRASVTAVRDANEQLQTGLDFAKVAIWRWISASNEIRWSGSVDEIYGKSALELSNYSQFLEVVLFDDRLKLKKKLAQSLTSGSNYEAEFRIVTHFGTRWIAARGRVLRDDTGQIYGMSGANFDITTTKAIEQRLTDSEQSLEKRVEERSAELAESELRYRLLVDGVKDYAILLLDAQGQVKSWNKGAELLTGYKSTDILGRHFSQFYTPAGVEAREPEQSLTQAIAQGRSCHEGWRKRKDGTEFWASAVLTSLLDSKGSLYGFSKIIRDMTEQRHVENLLIGERKRAESANEAKSAFLASMSHEIRTPMNAILGMADMLWESELSETQRQYVEIFRRAGGNLLTLINDILDLSKIESGNFFLEAVSFDAKLLIEQTVEILAPKAGSKAIGLRVDVLFSGGSTTLVGDPVRLQQVLLNLIGNAIKFTERGEVVVKVRQSDGNGFATLAFDISDTGIGIPESKLESIFEDFEQAEASTTRRFGGTGLGLGISRRLITRMGGEIEARSGIGNGTTFSFHVRLPIGDEQLMPAPALLDDIAGKAVLIIDDSVTNRMILGEMCSAWGMKVATCASGGEAVALMERNPEGAKFALALVDRLMPGMDGFETAAKVRKLDPATAIFIVSSDSQAGDISRCRKLGFAGHLVKPVRRTELLEQLVFAISKKNAPGSQLSIDPVGTETRSRILVAEDSEDNRFLLHAYCKGGIYDLTFVEDGAQAVESYRSGSFDLIVMDIQMPVMDGLTASREIRTIERLENRKRTPIVALTANALARDVSAARESGCDAHLAKPITKKRFLEGLGKWRLHPEPNDLQADIESLSAGEYGFRHIEERKQDLLVLWDSLERKRLTNSF